MSAIRRLYVASSFTPTIATDLRKALGDSGYGHNMIIEELSFKGRYGHITLSDESLGKIPDMEFVMADPDIIGHIFNHPQSQLVWAAATCAGVDGFFECIKDTKKTPRFTMTRHFAGFGQQMAEYIIGRIIFRERRFDVVHERQTRKEYEYIDISLNTFRTLDQLSIGILGFGELAQTVSQYCQAMGMTVWAAIRDERYTNLGEKRFEHVHHVRPMSRLNEMLASCDYIVNLLPSTADTLNFLSGDVLKPCRHKKSVFINVGRGSIIDENSLVNAIKSGWLGGAILDVFIQEPLPLSSPLWTVPEISITPHYSATTNSGKSNPTDSFIHNLQCYLDGKPMKGVVDFNKGY